MYQKEGLLFLFFIPHHIILTYHTEFFFKNMFSKTLEFKFIPNTLHNTNTPVHELFEKWHYTAPNGFIMSLLFICFNFSVFQPSHWTLPQTKVSLFRILLMGENSIFYHLSFSTTWLVFNAFILNTGPSKFLWRTQIYPFEWAEHLRQLASSPLIEMALWKSSSANLILKSLWMTIISKTLRLTNYINTMSITEYW